MKKDRRDFLKLSSLAGLGLAGNGILGGFDFKRQEDYRINDTNTMEDLSIIGPYGPWANSLISNKIPSLSYRNPEYTDLDAWKKEAKTRAKERLGIPEIGAMPKVTIEKKYTYDGLSIEELSWQLPYGRPTKAILMKPADAKRSLPGILGLHCHGGNKYFGRRKITKTGDDQHPLMVEHQDFYYEGEAWANEVAKRGYVVLVADAFTFSSRRVHLEDVPEPRREKLSEPNDNDHQSIGEYNRWASNHEHIMAKSLFCGGTTWPGVFLAEDRKALDILCAREDVDTDNIGCAGLSGGGLRTVMIGGLDTRIKAAVCVGFMSTWTDFLLHKSFTHTWMTYVPMLPNELDFPEILGLRVPLPTLVLNDIDDALYTMPEMEKADGILKEVFRKANAEDKYNCSFYPGKHKFDKPMQKEAFDWFDKWLKT